MIDFAMDLATAQSTAALGEIFRQGMARLVPADLHDIVVFNTPEGKMDLFLGTPGGFTPDEQKDMLDFLDRNPKGHPVAEHHVLGTGTGPVQVAELVGLRNWRRTEFYNRYNRRWRHDHELDCILPGGFLGGVAAISIARSSKAYTQREANALRRLARPIGLAVERLLRRRMVGEWVGGRPADPEVLRELFPDLTSREAEALVWLAEGKSDAEIACIMGIRRMTTSTHVRNIMSKLRVENRVCAAMAAARCLADRALGGAGSHPVRNPPVALEAPTPTSSADDNPIPSHHREKRPLR